MKVMHLIAPAPFGGAETVVKALALKRGGRGDTIVAALVREGNHPFVLGARAAGVDLRTIETGSRQYLRQVRQVSELIRRERVDVLHTHVYHANIVGFLGARSSRCLRVTTFHGHTGGSARVRLYERADRWMLPRFDAVICVSERQRGELTRAGIGPDRLHVIPNGATAGTPLPRAEARRQLGLGDGAAVGWIGRLSHEKGPDLLLDAVAALPGHITAVLLGDGPLRQPLEERARAMGLGQRVVFAGQRPDAGALIGAFDLLVLSSRTEGMPMVLLEAVAAGVPVAAFAVGGIPDYLNDRNGWVVPAGDTAALAAAVAGAIADPALRVARSSEASRLLDGPLGPDHWLDRIEAVYRGARRPLATASS